MNPRRTDDHSAIYLIGGGIASLAAAAFFVRDGDVRGQDITIFEESGKFGGSLDAAGGAEHEAKGRAWRPDDRANISALTTSFLRSLLSTKARP